MTRTLLHADPLAGRLPACPPAQAALSRLLFDARFAGWLQAAMGQPALRVGPQPLHAPWRVTLETVQGRCVLGLDPADWPALALAFGLDDASAAPAVANVLLGGWLEALAPALGPTRIVDIAPAPTSAGSASSSAATGSPALATVAAGSVRVALYDADAALLDHLIDLLARPGQTDLNALARLPLRPRLRLFARPLPRSVLRSLEVGDVVLCGEQPPRLLVGVGRALQVALHIHPQELTVQVAEHPHLTDDAGAAEAPDTGAAQSPGTLDELQLPVAFELDTARVSLADLAAMQPGYAVELDVPLSEATVRLICHGQTLGQGQLIAIGDRLGVRITRLEFVHDAAVAR